MTVVGYTLLICLLIAFFMSLFQTFFRADGVKGAEILFVALIALGIVALIALGIMKLTR